MPILDLTLTWFAVAAVALVAGVVLLVLDGRRRRRGAEVQAPEQRPAEAVVNLFEPRTPPDRRP